MTLKVGPSQYDVETEDVSYSGVFLATSLDLPLRQLIQLEGILDRETFVAHAMIVFARPHGGGRTAGVGVKFFGLSRETLERWARFVRAVRERELTAAAFTQVAPARPHAAIVLRVRPEGLTELVDVYTRDIAEGGMFVETDQPLLVGSRLTAEIIHPDTGEAFDLDCIVRRVVRDPKPGIGVEFTGLDPDRRAALHEFVSSVAPPIVIEEML
jgi:hypothetical protein